MRPTITCISPTFGRTTIVDLILSLVPQLKAGDEFILVGDGPVPFAEEASRLVPGVTYMHTPERTGDFGGTPLDYAIARARGDFIFFIGDDDLPVGHTFEVVRRGVRKSPMMPHVFAMLHSGNVLKNSVEPCRVSGQQLVFPRDLSRIPKYAECAKENMPLSDWVFIDRVVKAWGGVMFHEEIICILPRQNHGRMF